MSDENTNASDPLDLRDLLGKQLTDFPVLPDLPASKTFYGKTISISAGTSSQKGTPYFDIAVRLTDPGKDVTDAEMREITGQGFSLADYTTYCRFYLTPAAIPYGLRPFLQSIGFPPNSRIDETLKLDPTTFNPTEESQDIIRGRDVICRTKPKNDNGRVYRELDNIAGVKQP